MLRSDLLEGEAQDAVVSVDVFDQAGERVVHADITMYVSPKKPQLRFQSKNSSPK
jgi:hypothetical protein